MAPLESYRARYEPLRGTFVHAAVGLQTGTLSRPGPTPFAWPASASSRRYPSSGSRRASRCHELSARDEGRSLETRD